MAMVLGCVWDYTPGGCRSLHLSCETWPPVLQRMGEVPGTYIAGALVPALIITVLFYFDHSVSSQLAQARLQSCCTPLGRRHCRGPRCRRLSIAPCVICNTGGRASLGRALSSGQRDCSPDPAVIPPKFSVLQIQSGSGLCA